MDYVIFDLEWNQSPEGKKYSNRRLPFEIIEIGAVKLNERKETVDTFHRLIKPQVYNWIHNSIREVIRVNYKDLETGTPFPQAVREFIEWCGDDWHFCTWGNQDVMELQRNMKYYELLHLLPGPVAYYDIQKLFSSCFEDGESRRSLEYAIDFLGIKKGDDFHRAFADAFYTAKVLAFMENKKILPNIFIVVLPYVLVLNTYINMPIYNELSEYSVSFKLLLNMAIYFLIMCIYIYCFFIRKIVFNAITVYIGIGEILSIVFLSKYLPFALRNLMYSQIQLNIFVFGSFLVLYIMLLILHYKQKFYIHD